MTPSPLWYASRGLGMVLLMALTISVVLGIVTSRRWRGYEWPRFLTAGLHRNVALLALALLPLHGLAVVLDPYAGLGLKDITLPFTSSYRPLWLGLGVLAGELLIALVVTSLVRNRLGLRLWRLTHWLAYAAWPLAVLHGLGTGTDTRAGWALLIYAGCVAAVLLAILARLLGGSDQPENWRLGAAGLTAVGALALIIWVLAGPLQPGWAALAGTPKKLLGSQVAAAGSTVKSGTGSTAVPTGLDDPLQIHTSEGGSSGTQLTFDDLNNTALQIRVMVPNDDNATSGALEVLSQGQVVCTTQASFNQDIIATCGSTQLDITILGRRSAQLRTSAAS
ncbi:MAG: ferric reductase-like transmembrane domain-containing protein [Candidatus Dormibacteraceae bacterium]